MRPFRLTLFVLLFFYLAMLVVVSLNFTRTINWMTNHQDTLPYFTLTGLGVFLVLLFITTFERNLYQRKIAKKEAEKNEIKAQVFEMQRRNDEIEHSLKSFEGSISKRATSSEEPNTNERL